MKIEVVRISYNDIASVGLDGLIKSKAGRNNDTGLACHRGLRRSVAGMQVLNATGVPVANKPEVSPTINYEDLLARNFEVDGNGLSVPGKTDFSFSNLVLFHDGDTEEVCLSRKILAILDVEAYPVLRRIFYAYVRDEDGLLGME